MNMAKPSAKLSAIELRKAGYSYSHIAESVGVSKSTLASWLAHVPYKPNAETISRIGKARAASGAAKSLLKRESIARARAEAAKEIGKLSRHDVFYVGLGLYIGEGAKSLENNRFTNANPAVMRFMIRWYTEALGLKRESLKIRLHIYPDNDEETCITFWSQAVRLPRKQFLKTQVDWRKNKKLVKVGKTPYGTAHLTAMSMGEKRFGVYLARKLLAWSDKVLDTDSFAGLV